METAMTFDINNLTEIERDPAPILPSYAGIDAENFPATEWRSVNGYLASSPLPYCGRCDMGFITTPSEVKGRAPTSRLCPHCERPRRALKRIERAKLPAVAGQHTLSTYEWDSEAQRQRIGEVLDWIATPRHAHTGERPALLMYGTPGNGKSSMLHILSKHACFKGKRALFLTHEGLFLDIKASWNKPGKINPVDAETHCLNDIDLLCLDELGGIGGSGAQWTDWYKDQTRELIGSIHDRWSAGELAVVTTTNLNPKDILGGLLEGNRALASRVRSMFGSPVKMVGLDRRPQLDDGWC
jgi:DNA replication protein DnaC